MSFVIGTINLKYIKSAKITKKAKTSEHYKGADLPIIISLGKQATVLTLEGWFYNGQPQTSLESSFIEKLDNSVYKKVVINGPGTRYDGSWIIDEFSHEDVPADLLSIPFVLKFLKGGYYYVVTP